MIFNNKNATRLGCSGGVRFYSYRVELLNFYSGGLQAFRTLFNRELYFLSFFKGMITFAQDCGMVDEYVRAIFLS